MKQNLSPNAQLAMDTLLFKQRQKVPTHLVHIMEHAVLERIAGVKPGDYRKAPEKVYYQAMRNIGVCVSDQYLADNPLSMGDHGYNNATPAATTGAKEIWLDGMRIDSPEAVVDHLEKVTFERLREQIRAFDENATVDAILTQETELQQVMGETILKTGYGFIHFPYLAYTTYGYEHYFMAYALYPEVMEQHFSLQADLAVLQNQAAARAYREGGLPPLFRLDHDMADSRGTLVHIRSLERLWFPHFTRCLQPVLKDGICLMWHCDGNLMEMVPRLLDAGIGGFQGFQYEDDMNYPAICRMKTRTGEPLVIWAGVSVTRTMPQGTPQMVRDEMRWLVENAGTSVLFLGLSSSLCPGVHWENIAVFLEGLRYYREK